MSEKWKIAGVDANLALRKCIAIIFEKKEVVSRRPIFVFFSHLDGVLVAVFFGHVVALDVLVIAVAHLVTILLVSRMTLFFIFGFGDLRVERIALKNLDFIEIEI